MAGAKFVFQSTAWRRRTSHIQADRSANVHGQNGLPAMHSRSANTRKGVGEAEPPVRGLNCSTTSSPASRTSSKPSARVMMRK
jgi:hypothetical protein